LIAVINCKVSIKKITERNWRREIVLNGGRGGKIRRICGDGLNYKYSKYVKPHVNGEALTKKSSPKDRTLKSFSFGEGARRADEALILMKHKCQTRGDTKLHVGVVILEENVVLVLPAVAAAN